jgi:hypothetical protein
MASNVAVAQDPAGNLKPVMALGRAMVAQEEPQPSYQMFILG